MENEHFEFGGEQSGIWVAPRIILSSPGTGVSSISIPISHFPIPNWLINESALKSHESALKNLLLNLWNLPLKI